jgi:putative transposase
MPWKETCRMVERIRFIEALNERAEEEFFRDICREFGIAPKTGYKWVERFEAAGPEGLKDRRSAPRRSPQRVAEELAAAIVELRKEHPRWGPKKLRAKLVEANPGKKWPACSTIGDLLEQRGLVHHRRRRAQMPRHLRPLSEPLLPNDLWCADYKGHFTMGNGRECYPLTVTDGASRYLLKCEGMEQPRYEPTRHHFELAFREFGLPWRMRTDNGPPFASVGIGGLSPLSVWWVKLGIELERIEPGQPQQNGSHERMHRTLGEEVEVQQDVVNQQRELDRFRHGFNDVRPHEALGQRTPASCYCRSPRAYPAELRVPEYPDMEVRWVHHTRIKWRGQTLGLGSVLENEPVGLRQVGENRWDLFYAEVPLGAVVETASGLRLEAQSKKQLAAEAAVVNTPAETRSSLASAAPANCAGTSPAAPPRQALDAHSDRVASASDRPPFGEGPVGGDRRECGELRPDRDTDSERT